MKFLFWPALGLLAGVASAQSPSLEEVVDLPSVRSVVISPDGERAAILRRTTDREANRYLYKVELAEKGKLVPLADPKGRSIYGLAWSPDGRFLAYLASEGGSQIFLRDMNDGSVRQITAIVGGVSSYVWAPDGNTMALLLQEPPSAAELQREDRYGAFTLEGQVHDYQHLWLLDLSAERPAERGASTLRRLTGGSDFTVGSYFGGDFSFTRDGREVLFDHAVTNDPEDVDTQDISAVDIATGAIRPIVRAPGIDQAPKPSPDGKRIVFHRAPEAPYWFSRQYRIAVAPLSGGTPTMIGTQLNNDADVIGWFESGILFRVHNGVRSPVYRIDGDGTGLRIVTPEADRIHSVSASADGGRVAYVEDDADHAREAYIADVYAPPEHLTYETKAIANWPLHRMELVRWPTVDGTEIEGVLYLPGGAEAGPMPLLVIAHGGPATPYRPERVHSDIYPVQYWLDRGSAVLVPNFRGSGGYGDEFMKMNAGRLGEVYAEDILTGVDYLIGRGIAGPDRLGMMGFSAGGDAAAYIATHSDRFRAVSVGAGISDFAVDYVLNDQPRKLREYLGTPWEHPQVYARVSPVSTLAKASTPTLIQHGRKDNRVALANALALFRGLQHYGVETQLVIYDKAGHGFGTPRDKLAAMEHNRLWFDAYLFGKGDRPDLSLVELGRE